MESLVPAIISGIFVLLGVVLRFYLEHLSKEQNRAAQNGCVTTGRRMVRFLICAAFAFFGLWLALPDSGSFDDKEPAMFFVLLAVIGALMAAYQLMRMSWTMFRRLWGR